MNRFLLLALTAGLLSGCQSKRDICADYAADNLSIEEAAKKLGVENFFGGRVEKYCAYYKN